MKISVDPVLCQRYGQCVFTAPEVFDFDVDDQLVYAAEPSDEFATNVEAAAMACPVQAITVQS
ncbi:ferredoxin [Mycolicibacterium thermoresistibile]